MNITTRSIGNCTILDLDGQLVFGPDIVELRNAVRAAAQTQPQKIVLNLGKVSYVDSCGIGELISCYTHARSCGGSLVLLDLPKRVKELLVIAKLHTLFETAEDERSAVADRQEALRLRLACG